MPILIDENKGEAGNPWQIRFLAMFHMTNDSGLFRTAQELEKSGFWRAAPHVYRKGKESYVALYEATMCWHFDHRLANCQQGDKRIQNKQASQYITVEQKKDPNCWAEPRFWVPAEEVQVRLREYAERPWLLAFRDITNATNQRTCVACFLPCVATGNKLPLILSPLPVCCQAALLANLSSYALDFVARNKLVGTTLNYFILEQFPVLPPSAYDQAFHGADLKKFIGERVLKLVYTANDLQGFARDMGYDGPPFVWDDEERLHLRCQLDALYFHLYGLEREDIAYVMETFPIVHENDVAQYGTYRTQELILQYYNAYAAGDLSARVKEKRARSKA